MPEDDFDRERLARRWALVAAHRERLLRLARSKSASDADAEDAVQESLLRTVLFENLDEERVGPFLTTVTSRICADRHRSNGLSDRLHQRLGNRLVDEGSPEEQACDMAEAQAVAEVVATLPSRQQSVVRARSIGLSCTEVAHHLGLTYSAVESALSRARAAVRAKVDVCMNVAVVAGARMARAIRAVPAELPGATVLAIGGVVGALLTVTPAAPAVAAAAHQAPVYVTPIAVAPAAPVAHHANRVVPRPLPVRLPRVAKTVTTVARRPATPVVHDVGPVHVRDNHDGYTFEERLEHCVKYGVEVTTLPIHCKYPDEAGGPL